MKDKQMTADQMIEAFKGLENGQKIEFLTYLSDNHFNSGKPNEDMITAVRYHIEDYIDKELSEEEIEIMKLAYENGYFVGCKEGMKKVLKSED
jgi:predicted DNA binding protein